MSAALNTQQMLDALRAQLWLQNRKLTLAKGRKKRAKLATRVADCEQLLADFKTERGL